MPRLPQQVLSAASAEIGQYRDFSKTNVENVMRNAMYELGITPDGFVRVDDLMALRDIAAEAIYESTAMCASDVVAMSADFLEATTGERVAYSHPSAVASATPAYSEISDKMHAALGDVFTGKTSVDGFVNTCIKYADRMVSETHYRAMDRLTKDKPRWARVYDGSETCKFCLMLSSMGAVYHTAKDAGAHSHSGCDCRIVREVKGRNGEYHINVKGYDPDALYDQWKDSMRKEVERYNRPTSAKRIASNAKNRGNWQTANPVEVIQRLIPENALMRKASSSKVIYMSNASPFQVILDPRNGYFRITNTGHGDRFAYVSLDGSYMPDEMPIGEKQRLTHFRMKGE